MHTLHIEAIFLIFILYIVNITCLSSGESNTMQLTEFDVSLDYRFTNLHLLYVPSVACQNDVIIYLIKKKNYSTFKFLIYFPFFNFLIKGNRSKN